MKKQKLIILMVLLIITLCCCSCKFIGDQKYFCDVDNVISVEIIQLDGFPRKGAYDFFDYTLICKIEDYSAFIERLNNLKHRKWGGEPLSYEVGDIAIKIVYNDGNYDLIHNEAQTMHRDGKNKTGYFWFDKTEYDELIDEYVAKYSAK